MSALGVTGFLVVLSYLVIGVNSQLSCPCTGLCSAGNLTRCGADEICYTAEILETSTNKIKVQKGCKERSDCADATYCPAAGPFEECYRYGCCDTNACVVTNWAVAPDISSSTYTPTPSPTPSAIAIVPPSSTPTSPSIQEPYPKASSPLVHTATSSPVSMAIKQPVSMTTGQPMVKMTSQPVAAKSKIPTNEPMTSPADAMSTKQEVKPTASKEMMTSSKVKMEPKGTPTRVPTVPSLIVDVDTRPTCSSNCLFSCNVFFLIAVATLFVLF